MNPSETHGLSHRRNRIFKPAVFLHFRAAANRRRVPVRSASVRTRDRRVAPQFALAFRAGFGRLLPGCLPEESHPGLRRVNGIDEQGQIRGALEPTRWTWIQLARTPACPEASAALDALLRQYMGPIRQHIRFKFNLSDEDAADLQQSFVEKRIMQGRVLQKADQRLGKFRTFLLKAVDHFVADERKKAAAGKRRPPGGLESLDVEATMLDFSAPGAGVAEGDREWARSVVSQAIQLTREFYAAKGCLRVWSLFEEWMPGSQGPRPSLAALARKHGFDSSQQASNALVTVQRKLGTEVRQVIRRYAGTAAAIDEELRELLALLAEPDASPAAVIDTVCKEMPPMP